MSSTGGVKADPNIPGYMGLVVSVGESPMSILECVRSGQRDLAEINISYSIMGVK